MLQAVTDENRTEGIENFFSHNSKGKFLIGGDWTSSFVG
jgi:hypothetical protein